MKLKGRELTQLNCILDRYISKTDRYNYKDLDYDLSFYNISVRNQILSFINK